jgi:hypothetical protein
MLHTTYAMTGLTPSTDYDVYVQAVCSATDQSFWVGPLSISTTFVQPGCGDNLSAHIVMMLMLILYLQLLQLLVILSLLDITSW